MAYLAYGRSYYTVWPMPILLYCMAYADLTILYGLSRARTSAGVHSQVARTSHVARTSMYVTSAVVHSQVAQTSAGVQAYGLSYYTVWPILRMAYLTILHGLCADITILYGLSRDRRQRQAIQYSKIGVYLQYSKIGIGHTV
jgi:hypothetical protein